MRLAFVPFFIMLSAPVWAGITATNTVWLDFHWQPAGDTGQTFSACDTFVKGHEFDKAMGLLEQSRALNPADPAPNHQSALLHWISGNREEAARRFLTAFRSPGSQRVSAWALAAMSAQARSYPECVGWITQAAKDRTPEEIRPWLEHPYFAELCNYPPYRELLSRWDMRDICPPDVPIALPAYRPAADTKLDFSELLDRAAPSSDLKLSVEEDKPLLDVKISDDGEQENK